MGKTKPDVLQGTLDLLVLKTLSRGPLHGYGIAVHIEQISDEALRVEEGSLYPALHRIEQTGWIASEWGLTENNRKAKNTSTLRRTKEKNLGEKKKEETRGGGGVRSF